MGPKNNVGLGSCWIMECLLPYLCMVTVPHIMVGLERMLDYRGVGLARFHCTVVLYIGIYTLIVHQRTVRTVQHQLSKGPKMLPLSHFSITSPLMK